MQKSHYLDVFKHQDTHWWYQGMKNINLSLLRRYIPAKKNLKILDAGCGPGAALKYLSTFGDTIGVDLSDEALKYAKKRGKVVKGDVTNLPFLDESFDIVFSYGVLYHTWVKDDKKAIAEYSRVLKRGGLLLWQEPALGFLSGNEDEIALGRHRFTAGEFRSKLEDNSFSILKLTYLNFFLVPIVFLTRLPFLLRIKRKQPITGIFKMPRIVNYLFYKILLLENFLVRYIDFPFGMSVICIAKKNNGSSHEAIN